MSKNFPILEAAASHIEINGQMHELPVYLKHELGRIYVALTRHKSGICIYENKTVDIITYNRGYNGYTISTKQEFDRAFQDTFFHLAQISEGKL